MNQNIDSKSIQYSEYNDTLLKYIWWKNVALMVIILKKEHVWKISHRSAQYWYCQYNGLESLKTSW